MNLCLQIKSLFFFSSEMHVLMYECKLSWIEEKATAVEETAGCGVTVLIVRS